MSTRHDQGHFERIAIASDIHGPFVDFPSFRCFLGVLTEGNFDRVILNGDIADFSQISSDSHGKKIGGYQREFRDEVRLPEEILFIQKEILAPIRKAAGMTTPIVYRLGNHDSRWLSIAENNPTALSEMLKTMRRLKSLYLEEALELDKFKMRLSYNAIDVLYDTFTVIHGVKTSQMVAKANLLRYGSGTSGHSHRMNCFTQVMHGKLQGWWESGCLRTTQNIEYLPMGDKPDWSNGFLTLTINKQTGTFFCNPHFIINGKCEFNDQIISR